MPDDPKLPEPKHKGLRRTQNEWAESDRRERNKTIAVVLFVAALLGVGIWLLFLSVA